MITNSNYPAGVTDDDPHFDDYEGDTCEHAAPPCAECQHELDAADAADAPRCANSELCSTLVGDYGDLCPECETERQASMAECARSYYRPLSVDEVDDCYSDASESSKRAGLRRMLGYE